MNGVGRGAAAAAEDKGSAGMQPERCLRPAYGRLGAEKAKGGGPLEMAARTARHAAGSAFCVQRARRLNDDHNHRLSKPCVADHEHRAVPLHRGASSRQTLPGHHAPTPRRTPSGARYPRLLHPLRHSPNTQPGFAPGTIPVLNLADKPKVNSCHERALFVMRGKYFTAAAPCCDVANPPTPCLHAKKPLRRKMLRRIRRSLKKSKSLERTFWKR